MLLVFLYFFISHHDIAPSSHQHVSRTNQPIQQTCTHEQNINQLSTNAAPRPARAAWPSASRRGTAPTPYGWSPSMVPTSRTRRSTRSTSPASSRSPRDPSPMAAGPRAASAAAGPAGGAAAVTRGSPGRRRARPGLLLPRTRVRPRPVPTPAVMRRAPADVARAALGAGRRTRSPPP